MNKLPVRLLAFATKGSGSNEELRLRALLQDFDVTFFPFDRSSKMNSFRNLMAEIRRVQPDLVVMEGTGVAGGFACIVSRALWGQRFVFSSGDAVGPFLSGQLRAGRILFDFYERLLYRGCSGFIGWTPYLVGRAISMGARYGATAPGWAIGTEGDEETDANAERERFRKAWGIADEQIVFGIVGAVQWNARYKYCYGLDLVQAIKKTTREDVAVVVVGDGTGIAQLRQCAGDELGKRVFIPGPVLLKDVVRCMHAFDVASLPQSCDPVGASRYTTKLSEYNRANLPIVTLRIPVAYDLDITQSWRLRGKNPWDPTYIEALSNLMATINREMLRQINTSRSQVCSTAFSRDAQVARISRFLSDISQD